MGQHLVQETLIAGAKIAPAVGGVAWYTHTLQEWVLIATLVYVIMQAGLLIPTYINIARNILKKRKDKKQC